MSTTNIEQSLQIALAHHQKGELAQAENLYREVLAVQPQNPDALHLLGVLAHQAGQYDTAVELISRAIAEKSDEAMFHSNMGDAYRCLGRLDEAITSYERALALHPNYVEAHNNLGLAFIDKKLIDEAISHYKFALQIKPEFPEAYNNLGAALADKGHLEEAIGCYNHALALASGFAMAHNNLGNIFKDQGRLDQAIACYRQAIQLEPKIPFFPSSLLLALHYDPNATVQTLHAEHQLWDRQHGQPRRIFIRPHRNDPDPERRLKIGYVSPDLRDHPVGRFLLPLLENHDHEQFEITCYADVARPDAVTERLHACADRWRGTTGVSEERLTEWIREDGIDILVDLALHSAGNRLTVFARKPAPVQVTYLAYAGTSGLETMDYRLTDPYLDPPGENDDCYSEGSIRLPQTYWCYQATEEALPEVTPLPALSTGHITFGCLNNFSKVNRRVLSVWARLMQTVPNSQLVLFSHEGSHRDRTLETLDQKGIDPRRVNFVGHALRPDYLVNHTRTDIALDPFPFAGGTTTCDALWMGVPVVSLVGQTAVGRGGLSILSNIGLPEMAAQTEDEYVQIAVDLANDLPRLTHLRATMRERMQASPLMDAPRFAQNIEAAYRAMWQKWCEGQTQGKTLQGDNHVHNRN